MRIIIVQLPTSHLGAGECVYPLGLSRLASVVPQGTSLFPLDMNVHDAPWHALKTLIEENDPQIAALSFRNMDPLAGHDSSYLSSLVTATRLIKQTVPDCRIIVGGPGFSLFARDLMAVVPDIDIGLVGEGEIQFSKLVKAGCRPEGMPGSVWRQNGKIVLTPPEAKLDMAELPALSTSAFDPAFYHGRNAYVASMGIEGKRGCDLTCAYCVYPQLGGAKLRLRPPEHIVAEIESLHKSNGVNLFHFTDGVVNRPPEHFEAVCRLLRRRRMDIQWTGNLGAVIFNNVRLYPGAALTRRLIREGELPQNGNLIFPTYYNPCRGAHVKHEMEILCHTAGIFSSLGIDPTAQAQVKAV